MYKSPEIWFRADGDSQIGAGHIMRCLSLAEALRAKGARCVFVTAGDAMAGAIQAKGFPLWVLGTDRSRMEAELPLLEPRLSRADLVVADSYALTPAWLDAVQRHCPVAQFDDEDAFLSPAATIINYNLAGLDHPYAARYKGQPVRLLLGPAYAPLRPEFSGLPPRQIRPKATEILISTGGADPENVAGQFLDALARDERWQGVTFHLVVGALNPRLADLQKAAAALPGVQIHHSVRHMEALMLQCDAAVAAAGSTLYELCACGTPTLTYVLADNQKDGAEAFAFRGLMENLGDCRQNAGFYPRLPDRLYELCDDFLRRRDMAAAMQRTVDGRGAARLADALLG